MWREAGVPVAHAASELGVHRSRVHALIRSGALDATRVGSQLLVDPGSLERQLASDRLAGRSLAPHQAWAFLALASGDALLVEHALRGLSSSAVSRLRGRLRRGGVVASAPRLRNRSRIEHLRADPVDLAEIAAADRVVRTGASAAREHGFDIAAPGLLEAYVPEDGLERLTDSYLLERSGRPNVIFHVVSGPWPFPEDRRVAPGVVAALDLLEADDQRTQRAGREALERLAPRPGLE